MWQTPPYGEKTLLKSEKNILQISHLIFWMLQAAKYLRCDFTFTFSFFFICSKLNWSLFHLSGIIACGKNDGQGWNFHQNYLDIEKMRGKTPNPWWHSSHCALVFLSRVWAQWNSTYFNRETFLIFNCFFMVLFFKL